MRKTFLIIMLIITGFILTSCTKPKKGAADYTKVRAFVREEYYDRFDNKQFDIADFNLGNIKKYHYYICRIGIDEYHTKEERLFFIELKKTGKKKATEAIEHLEKLEFIENADYYYSGSYLGELLN